VAAPEPGAAAEDEQIAERVSAETVGAVEAAGHLARGEEAGHGGGLRLGIHADAPHHVVRGRADLHRRLGDVHVRQLHELLVHAGELPPDLLGLAARGEVEEGAAVRAPASLAHLLRDRARDHVARQQLRRAARLGLAAGDDVGHPALRLGLAVRDVLFERLRDVAEHEALAGGVLEHPALAAHALGHQDAAHAERPDHPRRMELHELHVDEVGTRVVGERMPVAGVLPRVAVDLVGAADPARRQHHGLGAEHDEAARLAPVRERAAHPLAVLQQARDRALHEDVDLRIADALVLERADHLEAGTVADVGQARVLMAAEVALQDAAVGRAVEERSPGLELLHPVGRFLREELRHAPVVQHLAAAHRVPEMTFQLSRSSVLASAAATPPSAITVCALPRSDLQTSATRTPCAAASIAARSPAPPAPTTRTS
jgi:hypothetical protein